jgi:hypothetical protein
MAMLSRRLWSFGISPAVEHLLPDHVIYTLVAAFVGQADRP